MRFDPMAILVYYEDYGATCTVLMIKLHKKIQ